jgi:hypothetical protein
MAISLIQIKRSANTSIPPSLANGELAYTANGDVLYIGSNGSILAIGGKRAPGILTANQAIVANSTSMIDKIMLGNTTVNAVVNSSSLIISNSTVNFTITKPTAAQVSDTNYFMASDSTWKQVSVGASSFDGLSDVTISAVANNDLAVYDGVTSQWVNRASGNGFVFVGGIPKVKANNGITVTSDGVAVTAANGISVTVVGVNFGPGTDSGLTANSTGAWITAGEALVTNTTGLHVGTGNGVGTNATTVFVVPGTDGGIVSNTTGTWVKAANGISLTAAGVNILGGSTLTVNTLGVHVNSTLSINTLSLLTPLPGTSGGTGLGSFTNQDILVANTINGFNKLALGIVGLVLQSNGTALIYDSLDGGTF